MTDLTPAEIAEREALYENGRKFFCGDVTFMLSAAAVKQLPLTNLPEVAFVGRSNVGKSSLLNALTNRNNMARTSSQPGRTQQINFFNLSDEMMLADLPGYGYAAAPKKTVKQWTDLIHDYLRGRVPLRRICLLIDARHGIKKNDLEIMKELDTVAVTYQIVLTKIDKVKKSELPALMEKTAKIAAEHPAAFPHILPTSTKDNLGIDDVRASLYALAHDKEFTPRHDG